MNDLAVTLEGYGVALDDPDGEELCQWCDAPADVIATSATSGVPDAFCTAHLAEYAPTYDPGPPLCEECGAYPAVIRCSCGGFAARGESVIPSGRRYWCRTGCGRALLSLNSCECPTDDMGECDHCGRAFYVWSVDDHCGECGQCFAHCHCVGGPNPHVRALVGGAA